MAQPIFKQVASYQYSSEAHIFKGKLQAFGIAVITRDSITTDVYPIISQAIGGVKLFVAAEDYIKAHQILAEINKFSIDDNGNAIQCPNCANEEIKLITTIKDIKSFLAFLISFLLVPLPFYTKYKYKCYQCKLEFK